MKTLGIVLFLLIVFLTSCFTHNTVQVGTAKLAKQEETGAVQQNLTQALPPERLNDENKSVKDQSVFQANHSGTELPGKEQAPIFPVPYPPPVKTPEESCIGKNRVDFYIATPTGGIRAYMCEGEEEVFMLGGVPYRTKVVFIASDNSNQKARAIISVNGISTKALEAGEDDLVNWVRIGIIDIEVKD